MRSGGGGCCVYFVGGFCSSPALWCCRGGGRVVSNGSPGTGVMDGWILMDQMGMGVDGWTMREGAPFRW